MCIFGMFFFQLLIISPFITAGQDNGEALSTSPFESGCLQYMLDGWEKKRVCNSEDDADAAERGICRVPPISHQEIRIFAPNWESGFLQSWLLQIILSEILDVPTTLETGHPDAYINYYDPKQRVEYGEATEDIYSLERAVDAGGDCTLVTADGKACAHYLPEIWNAAQDYAQQWVLKGVIEPTEGTGLLGYEGWFMPKFTGERDPSLLSYLGLAGESNRRKLAEAFLRPTTWKEYCELISSNRCNTTDHVAQRAPEDEIEEARFFVEGLYIGHFRKTEKNDCDKWPANCTGHIADFPCDWPSYTSGQTYHLDIALEGVAFEREGASQNQTGSYSYTELVDIWMAANATKSNVIMMWWSPELLFQQFLGSDAEFTLVGLPTPSQECFDNRILPEEKCSLDFESRVGSPLGVCGEAARPLSKMIASVLYETANDPSVSGAIRSPGYDVLNNYFLTNAQLNDIFSAWFTESTPRHAICKWAIENFDIILGNVPQTYPRVVVETQNKGLLYSSIVLGIVTTLFVLVTVYGVHKKRNEKVMKFAQLEFLWLLLAGSFIIGIGSIILGSASSDASCVAAAWFINIGYTLELVPLIVKITAINMLLAAAKRMRRLKLQRKPLFGGVLLILAFVILFLIVWTVVDPPRSTSEYILTQRITAEGDTIVETGQYCSSKSEIWAATTVAWNTLLLLVATVLAFQSRRLRSEFNESQTLALLIYSHFAFILLRVVAFLLSQVIRGSTLQGFRSLLLSIDTIATILIYFVPKFRYKENQDLSGTFATNQSSRRMGVGPIPVLISNITLVSAFGNAWQTDQAVDIAAADYEYRGGGEIVETVEGLSPSAVEDNIEVLVPISQRDEVSLESEKKSNLPLSFRDEVSLESEKKSNLPLSFRDEVSLESEKKSNLTTNTDEDLGIENLSLQLTVAEQTAIIFSLQNEIAEMKEKLLSNEDDVTDLPPSEALE